MPSNAPFVDRDGCRALRPFEPRHNKPGARRFHVGVAKLGNSDRFTSNSLLARRVLSLIGRADDLLSTLPRLVYSPRPMIADRYEVLLSASPPLDEESLFARTAYAYPEPLEPIIPDNEPTFLWRLQAVDDPLGQPCTLGFRFGHRFPAVLFLVSIWSAERSQQALSREISRNLSPPERALSSMH